MLTKTVKINDHVFVLQQYEKKPVKVFATKLNLQVSIKTLEGTMIGKKEII